MKTKISIKSIIRAYLTTRVKETFKLFKYFLRRCKLDVHNK